MKGSQYLKKKAKPQKNEKETFEKNVIFDRLQKIHRVDLRSGSKKGLGIFKSAIKNYETDIQLAFIPIILLVVLSIIVVINNYYLQIIADNQVSQADAVARVNPFPLINYGVGPEITAKAAIVIDADSQTVLFRKNPELRFSMASTTKIMTALTALEYYQPKSILIVRATGIPGSGLGLELGERWYFQDLLYAMLLPSANDAAFTIAENYPGGVPSFVARMNKKTWELHLENTHYSDSTGLDDDGDYTTVVDMARLAAYAIKNKSFAQTVGTKEKVINNVDYTRQFSLVNLNKLLGSEGVTGIKTGTTEGAGEVLVTSTVENNHTFILVVMNSIDRFSDTKSLMEFTKANVKYVAPDNP